MFICAKEKKHSSIYIIITLYFYWKNIYRDREKEKKRICVFRADILKSMHVLLKYKYILVIIISLKIQSS